LEMGLKGQEKSKGICEMGDKVMHEIQLKRSTKARL